MTESRSAWQAAFAPLAALCLMTSSAAAQMVVRPDPPLSAPQARLRDAAAVVRDSITQVDGAMARLERDFDRTSGASLRSRASVLGQACARLGRSLLQLEAAFEETGLPAPDPRGRRPMFDKALEDVAQAAAQCRGHFTELSAPGREKDLREWAHHYSAKLYGSLRSFETSLQEYLAASGIRLRPVTPKGASGR